MDSTPDMPSNTLSETEDSVIVYRDADAPFADDDADLILRSSDRVDFKVHKIILIKTFQLFDDMLVRFP
jgi:hypothetical protein